MTHSSGIVVSSELEKVFGEARKSNDVRWFRIEITLNKEPEQLVSVKSHPIGKYEEDFKALQQELKPKEPCYLVFRKDEKNVQEELGYQWVFISYVPDGSPVRARMLYASSRDNLKKGLGYSYFTKEIHASEKDEITLEVVSSANKETVKVFSESELQIQEEKKLTHAERSTSMTSGDNVSVKFPLADDAKQKLLDLGDGNINFVQICLDLDKETVELSDSGNVETKDLPSKLPTENPTYNIYRWKHKHNDEDHDKIIFVYCCPTGVSVRPRMLYSTVKTTVVNYATQNNAKPAQNIEISSADEWTEKIMIDYLHPKKATTKKSFNRPKRPGKGGRRLVRRNK